ncbi:MAG: hypothetical protein A3G47_00970 [Candidatus Zambryskibacteria bacterium RIFCSPLOWO2_12_FULL_39_45]|nr:MAG: hypothetical protein UT81_C0001G0054 [Parcubacteria group bacterium GW2011_GWA2_40_14]OHB08115.1 MAG: hypothetical protein A2W64_03215 [Candidatus Zambryskibacteria bacterium RIFCSPLOWO2_02_39_10]OHB10585.1 MAG: hypothetical protein A3I21_00865 [Candidatus Zambryskibacteria bacterium RIFCSPLOWO2_02_FULL_39_69]OHB14028.1 MAG: hypothetical protein A3G47_00970 [Candidatus Zambryskibacteria bacterium RIFCSPLOWO2_12_FULL_39_45]
MSKTQQLGKNMSPSKTKLGKFLRKCRIKLGLRQVEVGRLSMVKQSDYSHFETGRSKYLNPKQIKGLAKTLKCQEVELEILVPPKPKPKQEPTTELGLLIRNRREELGLTIETFAKKLKISLAQAKCLETRIAERMKYKLFEPLLRVLELKPSDLGRFVGWTKNESLTSLGQVIRSRRKELGFSLASLGQKLGITRERVRQIENNRSSFSNKGNKLKKIAKILNLNFSELQALQPARRFKRGKIGTDTFGGFLTARRVELHLTQYELAERVGISPNTICATELGKFVPNSDMLGKMATALDCVIPSQLILIPRKRGRPRKDLINS